MAFAHTSSKIDVALGTRLFRHLLALPNTYFQARRGRRFCRPRARTELENIRFFLTGHPRRHFRLRRHFLSMPMALSIQSEPVSPLAR